LQGLLKFPQIGIFGSKIYHLATLVIIYPSFLRCTHVPCLFKQGDQMSL
jgi:hypothetical protein